MKKTWNLKTLAVGTLMIGLLGLGLPSSVSASIATPSNLTAKAVSASQINLQWIDNSNSEQGTGIERANSSTGPWTQIATVGRNVTSYSDTGLKAGTMYVYRVRAFDNQGSTAYSNIASATTGGAAATGDTTPPSSPTGLLAIPASSSQINLSWNGATDTGGSGLAGYKIFRGGVQIATTTATSYSNTGLSADTQYCYNVAAYDNAGNTSILSSQICAASQSTSDTTPPSVPSGLTAAAVSSSQINLSWSASTDTGGSGLAGYKIFRSGVQIATSTSTSYSNTGLSASTQYCYTVAAYDNAGNTSAQSTQACATTPAGTGGTDTTPPSVTLMSPANGSTVTGTINVTASASDNVGVTKVEFYMDTGTLLGTATASPYSVAFNSTTVPNGSHSLYAKAYDAAGNWSTSVASTVTVSNSGGSTGGQLQWLKTAKAQDGASGTGVVADHLGNVIAVGSTQGTVDFGTGGMSVSGASCFIAKYNDQGTLLWVKLLGGGLSAVGVDSQNNILTVGDFQGTVDFSGNGAAGATLTSAGGLDIVVAKYSAAGGLMWARRFGGTSNDYGYNLAVDASDNLLIGGTFQGTVSFDAFNVSSAGVYDICLAKLSSSSSVMWARSVGGPSMDNPGAVAVDRNGDVVLTGQFFTSINLGGGTMLSAGSGDIFLAKYSGVDGSYRWSKSFGGTGGDSGQGVTTDPNTGNIVMTGGFSGTVSFGGGLRDTFNNGGVFVAGYDPSGNYLWDMVTGAAGDVGMAARISGGYLAVTGKSAAGIYFGGSQTMTGNGQPNFFVATFGLSGNTAPSFRWAKMVGAGTNGASAGAGVAFSSAGQLLAAGSFTGTLDWGTSATSPAGFNAAFVAAYTQ